MKKLLLICLMLTVLALQAQDRKVITSLYSVAIQDTTVTLTMDGNYAWGLQLVWSGGTGTLDATCEIQVSNYPTSNFIKYSDNSSTTLTAASGNWVYESGSQYWKYWRLVFTDNNMTGATITAKLVRMRL